MQHLAIKAGDVVAHSYYKDAPATQIDALAAEN
jgi:hypothetical protein